MDTSDRDTRHPNDRQVVSRQLEQAGMVMTEQERQAMLASIDRQIREIDARQGKRKK
jgi:hypothetical protein